MNIANLTEPVYVTLTYGPRECRGILDIDSTTTLLNGVRLIYKFVAYEPTPENKICGQNVSGS